MFRDRVHLAESVAFGASPVDRVGRECVCCQHRRTAWILAGARVQHAKQIGKRGDASHRRSGCRHAALLLQRDCGRKTVDRVDVRYTQLLKEAPSVGRDGFEIPALGLRVERAERKRRLARP